MDLNLGYVYFETSNEPQMETITTTIRVDQLMPYREYDRMANPAPQILFVHQYSMLEIMEWVSLHGIVEPLELSVMDGTALLTDGNHRLAAAHHFGIVEVPVRVVFYDSVHELNASLSQQTIERFKPVF